MAEGQGRTAFCRQYLSGDLEDVAEVPDTGLTQCHIKDNSSEVEWAPDAALAIASAAVPLQTEPATSKTPSRARLLEAIERGDEPIYRVFPNLIPTRPYCADDYTCGVKIRSRPQALEHRHVQFNRPCSIDWLGFDVDRPGAWCAWDDAGLPAPNVISVNPENDHAHLGYLLRAPVLRFATSARRPLHLFADIQRGYTRRLGADHNFNGLLLKNPLHPSWRTTWLAARPYTLGDLDSALERIDKRPFAHPAQEIGEGRNVFIFNALRQTMYREALHMFGDPEQLRRRAEELAARLNQQFDRPLSPREVTGIARSITRWILRNFSAEDFSAIQRRRAGRRWAGHIAIEKLKPWDALGISRATYYRWKKRGLELTQGGYRYDRDRPADRRRQGAAWLEPAAAGHGRRPARQRHRLLGGAQRDSMWPLQGADCLPPH
jgi:hypothetical protein